MKINAGGIWLSDGTKLEQATQRTLRLAFATRAGKKREAVASRIVQAIRDARGKRWNGFELACWIDNAIADSEIDGGVLLLVLAGFERDTTSARAKKGKQARGELTGDDIKDIRRRAGKMQGSKTSKAKSLAAELGIDSSETVRAHLKEPKKKI